MTRAFRFSFNIFGVSSGQEFRALCRGAETAGFDAIYAADHVGAPAPFPVLVAAAEATERLRVGTLVLNVPFWNPALLAREVATTDVLTDGRLELGLGAGHMKWEFDAAEIPWEAFGRRTEGLASTIEALRHWFTVDQTTLPGGTAPHPLQQVGFGGTGPPLLVGGTGDRVLRIAAEHADIIGVAGVFQLPGEPPGTFRLATAPEAAERVSFVRGLVGDRPVEWHLLVQMVVSTDNRRAAAQTLVAQFPGSMTVDEVLETPYLLIGTPQQMAEQLLESRYRYGFSHVTVHEPFREGFEPVIALLR